MSILILLDPLLSSNSNVVRVFGQGRWRLDSGVFEKGSCSTLIVFERLWSALQPEQLSGLRVSAVSV